MRRALLSSASVPALSRSLILTSVSLALMLACAGKRKGGREHADEHDSSKADDVGASAKPLERTTATERATPPVDVVALDSGEARPCERMCGRIGDCVQTAEAGTPAEATGVEFACLDTCIYADPLQSASTAFQDCDQKSACTELLGCARGRWDAVTAARRQVEVATQFAVIRDTCEVACLTLQSCNYFYQMPDQLDGMGTPDFLMVVEACTEGCRNSGEQGFAAYAECGNESSCDQFWACTARP